MLPYRIIALGDSITYGYPFGHKYSWVELLSQKMGIPLVNAGNNGDTLWDMMSRMSMDIIDQEAEVAIILGGTNDICQGISLEIIQERFKKIVKVLRKHKVAPVLALPTPIHYSSFEKNMVPYRTFIRKYSKEKKIPLIDFYRPFLTPTRRVTAGLLEDGVHPSVVGYQLMAEVAQPVLTRVLK